MKKWVLTAATIITVSACAQAPEQIAAVEISDTTYSGSSCRSLVDHEIKQTQLLHALSADQKKAQSGDAFGVFLLGLPISSMSGADKETEIAVAKGRIDAIRRQQARKGCEGAPEEALRPASASENEDEDENAT